MVTVTQAVLAVASEQGPKPAVVDAADGRSISYAELEELVPATATGLASRGLRQGDAVALHMAPGRDYALALHALAAAGAVIVPVDPHIGAEELTGVLCEHEVRMIVTAPDLVEVASTAVESSYVRQVITFGDVDAATSFAELADSEPVAMPVVSPDADVLQGHAGRMSHADRLDRLRAQVAKASADASDIVVARLHELTPEECADVIDVALLLGVTLVVAPAGARIVTAEPGRGGRPAGGYPMRAIDLYSR